VRPIAHPYARWVVSHKAQPPERPLTDPTADSRLRLAWRQRLPGTAGLKQSKGIDPDARGNTLDAPQREVSLAALKPAHVGAVKPEELGKCLLTETLRVAVGPKVAADRSLKLAFHAYGRSPSAT
jgi:hypothetical protein